MQIFCLSLKPKNTIILLIPAWNMNMDITGNPTLRRHVYPTFKVYVQFKGFATFNAQEPFNKAIFNALCYQEFIVTYGQSGSIMSIRVEGITIVG